MINVSFSLNVSASLASMWFSKAESMGITVIVAAGNDSKDVLDVFGSLPTAVSVGSVDNSNVLAPSSNCGPAVRIYAQGVDIQAAYGSPTTKTLAIWSGTSFSAAFVSGAAALVKQRHLTWTPADIRSALYASVDPAYCAPGVAMTSGRINLKKAVAK